MPVHQTYTNPDTLNSLEHQWPLPVLAQELQVFPISEQAGVRLLQPLHAQIGRLLVLGVTSSSALVELDWVIGEVRVHAYNRLPVELRHEHGIGGADLNPDAMSEGDVRAGQVVRPPAERHRVERHDERLVVVLLRALEEREGDVVVLWPAKGISLSFDKRFREDRPVELVPAVAVAICLGYLFDRTTSCGAEDEGHAKCLSCACGVELCIWVEDCLDSYRRDENGAGVGDAEDSCLSAKEIISFCILAGFWHQSRTSKLV